MIDFEVWAKAKAMMEYQNKDFDFVLAELNIDQDSWHMANSLYKSRIRSDDELRETYEAIAEEFKH